MKLPCKECIIQVNCSEQCEVFKNYNALLNNAIQNFERLRHNLTPYNQNQLKQFRKLKNESDDVSHEIFTRGLEKAVEDMFN